MIASPVVADQSAVAVTPIGRIAFNFFESNGTMLPELATGFETIERAEVRDSRANPE